MSVELATWYVPALGFGYSLRLRAVQVIELVEYSGGGGADNAESFGFGEVKGGFVGETEEDNEEESEESEEENQASSSAVPF